MLFKFRLALEKILQVKLSKIFNFYNVIIIIQKLKNLKFILYYTLYENLLSLYNMS